MLRQEISASTPIFLMFDNCEKANKETLITWKNIALNTHHCFSNTSQFKTVFAGRYITLHPELSWEWEKEFQTQQLTPLDSFVIKNLIAETTFKEANHEYIEYWTELVNEISCGHARIIVQLIEKIEEATMSSYLSLGNEQKNKIFKEFAFPEIELTMTELDEVVRTSLSKLAVFRRFNIEVIKELQNRKHLTQDLDATTLLRNIRITGLIRETESGWHKDAIFRELLLK
ncbi:MAG: hypothetical protein VSS52_001655 [Thiotrichaceae bacterium]|nr:hypothetical protein [Thiotrichaceae bacterium]